MIIIETERLLLRTWKEEDVEPFYQVNQDSRVLELLTEFLFSSREEVKNFIHQQEKSFAKNRYMFFAVEEKISQALIGFCGLMEAMPPLSVSAVEIGWRLASGYWGKGYATELADAVLDYGWNELGLKEIFACTAAQNNRSQRVMKKIGMTRDLAGDFLHPKLPSDHRLALHVLYRIKREEGKAL